MTPREKKTVQTVRRLIIETCEEAAITGLCEGLLRCVAGTKLSDHDVVVGEFLLDELYTWSDALLSNVKNARARR